MVEPQQVHFSVKSVFKEYCILLVCTNFKITDSSFDRYAVTILSGFATASNTQDDVDRINNFVQDHITDLQGKMSSIEGILKTAALNIEWNETHLEDVLKWLDDHLHPTSSSTETPTTTPSSSSTSIKMTHFLLISIIARFAL